jgi:hypothetical protein
LRTVNLKISLSSVSELDPTLTTTLGEALINKKRFPLLQTSELSFVFRLDPDPEVMESARVKMEGIESAIGNFKASGGFRIEWVCI